MIWPSTICTGEEWNQRDDFCPQMKIHTPWNFRWMVAISDEGIAPEEKRGGKILRELIVAVVRERRLDRGTWWYEIVGDPKRKRLPINKKPAYLSIVFHADRIDYRFWPEEVANAILSPFFHRSSFLPLSFPPLAGLSFVKLDNLVPSLRAITLDYFCLQSCAPPYTLLYRWPAPVLGRAQRQRTMRKVGRENEKDKARGGDITTRRGRKGSRRDRAIERPFPLDCWDVCRERTGVISCACARKIKLGN